MENENVKPRFGYICMYKGKQYEVYANTSYEAQTIVAKQVKVRKQYEISVYLAEKDGETVVHSEL